MSRHGFHIFTDPSPPFGYEDEFYEQAYREASREPFPRQSRPLSAPEPIIMEKANGNRD